MASWINALTGEIAELPDDLPDGVPHMRRAEHRRLVAALDRSKRWQRIDDAPPPPAAGVDDSGAGGDLESMTVAQLRELAAARGLPVYGTKSQIIERLRAG